MCLVLTVTAPATARDELAKACLNASAFGLVVGIEHPPRWPWAKNRPVRAFISEDGSCACSLLADDADWNAESWAMRPDIVEALARTLEALGAAAVSNELSFEALWIGDAPKETVRVTVQRLSALARSSSMGTRTKYEIVGRTASG